MTRRKVIYLKTTLPLKNGTEYNIFDKIPRCGKSIQALTSYKLMLKRFSEMEALSSSNNNKRSLMICHMLKYQELL